MTATAPRRDWEGLTIPTWNRALESGGVPVSKKIESEVEIEGEAVRREG
ncbi:hypothetical protein [Embleya sp. NPDC050493]